MVFGLLAHNAVFAELSMTYHELGRLESAFAARAARHGLHADTTRVRYANGCLYAPLRSKPPKHTLYVGVGHGLDAMLALRDGFTESIVGVDPYIGEHGNDDSDYRELLEIIHESGLDERFHIERSTIQDFVVQSEQQFDLIVCNDVLHHIFWTEHPLSRSTLFPKAVSLFKKLALRSAPNAVFVIGEPERHGLRQFFTRMGILRSSVKYATKQPWREWVNAVSKAGWTLVGQTNYIPWRFRNQGIFWSGKVGRYTICDRYFLYFRLLESR